MAGLYNLKRDVSTLDELAGQDTNSTAVVKLTSETIAYDDFTDGGGAVGTYTVTAGTIPAGAHYLGSQVANCVGFAGDTSAVLTIGDGSDPDRYNTGTVNVFATAATGIDCGVPSGARYHPTAKSIVLTITTDSDFTSVSAGSLALEFFYLT